MATLKANNCEIVISYLDINNCYEIEYGLEINWQNKSLINPDCLVSKQMCFSDCIEGEDWLLIFFIDILNSKKGTSYTTIEPPEIKFELVTWLNIKAEREKEWEGKTCAVKQENGEIIDEPYEEMAKWLIIPLLENQIKLNIELPSYYFIGNEELAAFNLTFKTDFTHYRNFCLEMIEEMKDFFKLHTEKVKYIGDGKFEILDENWI